MAKTVSENKEPKIISCAKSAFEKIMSLCNGELFFESNGKTYNVKNNKVKIVLRDSKTKRRIWFKRYDEQIDFSKKEDYYFSFDDIRDVFENKRIKDIFYEIYLTYIIQSSMFEICSVDTNGYSTIISRIPPSNTLPELYIKLQMTV